MGAKGVGECSRGPLAGPEVRASRVASGIDPTGLVAWRWAGFPSVS